MSAVHIRIGHDDDLVVAQLADIEVIMIPVPKAVIIALISALA